MKASFYWFITYFYFNKNFKIKNKKIKDNNDDDSDEFEETENETTKIDETKLDSVFESNGYYWFGKDYANTYINDFKNLEDTSKDQFDRKKIPRMPWRDQGLVIYGESARDLSRHFIQRWNECKVI